MKGTLTDETLSDFAENSRSLRRQTRSLILDSESKREKDIDFLANLIAVGQSDATEDRQLSIAKISECFAQQTKELSRLTRRIENLEATNKDLEATNKEYWDLLTKREDHMTNCMEKTSTLCHKIVMLLSENVAAEAQKYSSAEVDTVASSRKRKTESLE